MGVRLLDKRSGILHSLLEPADYRALRDDPDAFEQRPAGLHSPLMIPGMEQAIELLRDTV